MPTGLSFPEICPSLPSLVAIRSLLRWPHSEQRKCIIHGSDCIETVAPSGDHYRIDIVQCHLVIIAGSG